MTNEQVLALAEGLPLVDVPDMTGAFNYAVSVNLLEAQRIAPSIQKGIEPDEKMAEYDEKSKKLLTEHANKDEKGKAITQEFIVGNRKMIQYDIPGLGDPESEYSKAVEKLKEEYKEVIKAHNKKLEFLDKENKEFKPILILVSEIPKGLSREASNTIVPLVEKK